MITDIIQLKNQNLSWNQIAEQVGLSKEKVKHTWRYHTMETKKLNVKNELHTVFLEQDRLYCRWYLHPDIIAAASCCAKPMNPTILDLRIFDVTDIYFNGTNEHSVTCIKVSVEEQFWVIKGLKHNRSYICELGYLTEDYMFFPILRSHPVHTAYKHNTDYLFKIKEAEEFRYRRPLGRPAWIEHPDCLL